MDARQRNKVAEVVKPGQSFGRNRARFNRERAEGNASKLLTVSAKRAEREAADDRIAELLADARRRAGTADED